jgi:hypothetical protein
MLGSEVAARELELQCPGQPWAVVMLGEAAQWHERPGIGERNAPAVEADDAPHESNRLQLDRRGVET